MQNLKTIIERLNSRVSKAEILAIANEVTANQIDFKPLFPLLIKDNQLAMRTAWLIENIIIPRKELHTGCFDLLTKTYLSTQSGSVRRIIGKTIAACEIPKHCEDELNDFCTKLITNSDEEVAAKVHAMIIAAQVALRYPDLIPELKETIEGQFEKNSVAFRAGAKRAFKHFKKAGY